MADNGGGYRVVRLDVQNVKRIRALTIDPDPSAPVVKVGGRNGQGKSSTLDAIMFALGGAGVQDAVPKRLGEDEAYTEVRLQDPESGDCITVRREWRASGSQVIRLLGADGGVLPRPQEKLDAMLSRISFDPLGFADLPSEKQVAMIVGLVGLDPEGYKGRRKALEERRRDKNREVAVEEAAARQCGKITGAQPVDEAPLWARLRSIEENAKAAAAWDQEGARLVRVEREAEAEVEHAERALYDARVKLAAAKEARAKAVAEARAPRPARPVVEAADDVKAALQKAQFTNQRVREEAAAKAHGDRAAALQAESDAMTQGLERLDREWAATLEAARWPIAGLTIKDERLLYRGVPLEQCSSAERIRVAVAVGIALGKGIRVLLVREGSLLDDGSVEVIRSIAREHGFQVWMERVGSEEDAVIIEDGAVLRRPERAAATVA